jgi:hypothetical protein
MLVSRRSILLSISCSPLLVAAVARDARADVPPPRVEAARSRVRSITHDARGTTIEMELLHAPFPAAGSPYKDSTVIVFVPHHYRFARDGRVSMLVHFHGHTSTAPLAMAAHELREQLFDSKQNAILVVPQGPVLAADSSCGKLEVEGGFARLLDDVLRTITQSEMRVELGASAIPEGAREGTVCISAHSGGYHAAAQCVKHGGVEVTEVYLFDALYGDSEIFRDWVLAGRGRSSHYRHKLVVYTTGGATEAHGRQLMTDLETAGVHTASETHEGTLTRTELTRAEAVYIKTQLSHGGVTHELNGLRDCLYASALPRRLRTSWFESRNVARPLERRDR